MKTCTKCERTLPISDFHKLSASKDGLDPQCKKCATERVMKWREANPERHQKNQVNRARGRVAEGLCYYCSKPIVSYSKNYCEYHWLVSIANHNLGNGSREGVKLLRQKLEEQNHTCPYTGEKLLLGINSEVDHILPTSRYPELKFDIDNIEWVSKRVNQAKRNLTKDEFIELCKTIARNFD